MGCQGDSPPYLSIGNDILDDNPTARSGAAINRKRKIVGTGWQSTERNLGAHSGKYLALEIIAHPVVLHQVLAAAPCAIAPIEGNTATRF